MRVYFICNVRPGNFRGCPDFLSQADVNAERPAAEGSRARMGVKACGWMLLVGGLIHVRCIDFIGVSTETLGNVAEGFGELMIFGFCKRFLTI